MKRCPACDKTFADGMKFCQTDGTLLIEDAPPADPYKTVVGNQSDIAAAIPPLDPFKTMVANAPPKAAEEDILQLPEEPDMLETMVVSPDELKGELKTGSPSLDVPPLDLPASAPPIAPSAPLIEPKPAAAPNDFSAPPKFNEPPLSPPNFGGAGQESGLPKPPAASPTDATAIMDSSVSKEIPPSPFDSKPFQNDFSSQSPYGNQENKPIPSPFQDSLQPGYQPPSASPFDAPKPMKEVEPNFGGQPESSSQSPFQPPTPFGQPDPFGAPIQQSAWTPPPVPTSEWGNQELGANTPVQPSAAGSGLDQTLPIISLVLGILSLCCYVSPLTGLGALVTGFLGMKNANADPSKYGGKTLAIIGMILGGLFFLIGVAYYILVVILGVAGSF